MTLSSRSQYVCNSINTFDFWTLDTTVPHTRLQSRIKEQNFQKFPYSLSLRFEHLIFIYFTRVCYAEFQDTKGIIRICKSKDRQHNGEKKKDKTTNTDLQNITHTTKDWVTPRVNLGAPGGWQFIFAVRCVIEKIYVVFIYSRLMFLSMDLCTINTVSYCTVLTSYKPHPMHVASCTYFTPEFTPGFVVWSVLLIFLFLCLCVLLLCVVRCGFPIETMFGSSLPPVVCRRDHVLRYLWLFAHSSVSNTYCVVGFDLFVFVYVANFSGLSIFDCPSVFSKFIYSFSELSIFDCPFGIL